jgi:predicted ArsR family transcriptional regulator
MDEAKYRGSRLCRLLGNPVVFQIVLHLDRGGPLTPSRLAKFVGRSVQAVSSHLAKLRAADVVRYSTAGRQVRYWLKHKRATRDLLQSVDRVVRALNRLET